MYLPQLVSDMHQLESTLFIVGALSTRWRILKNNTGEQASKTVLLQLIL